MQTYRFREILGVKLESKKEKHRRVACLISRIVQDRRLENYVWSSHFGFNVRNANNCPLAWIGCSPSSKFQNLNQFVLMGEDKAWMYVSTDLGLWNLRQGEMVRFPMPNLYFPQREISSDLAAPTFAILAPYVAIRDWNALALVCRSSCGFFFHHPSSPFAGVWDIICTQFPLPLTQAMTEARFAPGLSINHFFGRRRIHETMLEHKNASLIQKMFPKHEERSAWEISAPSVGDGKIAITIDSYTAYRETALQSKDRALRSIQKLVDDH
jgi:hypothetical protein